MTNLENSRDSNLESSIQAETQEALTGLKQNVENGDDRKKFESLSKNPTLQRGLNKLYDKSCKETFEKERKQFENMNISKKLNEILKKYPSLLLHITGNLGLPLGESKFSKLSTTQKLNYTILYEAIYGSSIFYKKNLSTKDIMDRITSIGNSYTAKLNRSFERKNVKNFLQLEKTLKEDFGLTQIEAQKVKEYLELIKKHPEFMGDMKTYQAGMPWGYIIVAGLSFVLGAIGMHYIDNIGKINPETTTLLGGDTRIENPEKVLKRLSQQADFSNSGHTDIKMFAIDENEHWMKKYLKDFTNKIQSKQINMELSGQMSLQFDLDQGCQIDIHSVGGKGIAYVQLPNPDVVITESRAKILSENRERIHLSDFDQAQENLRQELEQKAINDAKKEPGFYEKGKQDIQKQLLDIFSALRPEGIDIQDVKVSFFEPGTGPKSVHPDYSKDGLIIPIKR